MELQACGSPSGGHRARPRRRRRPLEGRRHLVSRPSSSRRRGAPPSLSSPLPFPLPARAASRCTRGPFSPSSLSFSLSLPPRVCGVSLYPGILPSASASVSCSSPSLSAPPRRAATLQASVRPRHRPRRGIEAPLVRSAVAAPRTRRPVPSAAPAAPRRRPVGARPRVCRPTPRYPQTFRGLRPTSLGGPPGNHWDP